MMLTLASVATRNGADGAFSLKRTTLSPTLSIDAMLPTNGLYIGAFSPCGAVKEKMTSSVVSGVPSCHFTPLRMVTSIVVPSTQL